MWLFWFVKGINGKVNFDILFISLLFLYKLFLINICWGMGFMVVRLVDNFLVVIIIIWFEVEVGLLIEFVKLIFFNLVFKFFILIIIELLLLKLIEVLLVEVLVLRIWILVVIWYWLFLVFLFDFLSECILMEIVFGFDFFRWCFLGLDEVVLVILWLFIFLVLIDDFDIILFFVFVIIIMGIFLELVDNIFFFFL